MRPPEFNWDEAQSTQVNLAQLGQVVEMEAAPELMERRRRALIELVETLQPQAPLWTVVGGHCPKTESEYLSFLRGLAVRAGLSYQQIASRTALEQSIETVPRSTVHSILKRDRLPRREDQLRALLMVLITPNSDTPHHHLDDMLALRAQLIAARTAGTPETGSSFPPESDVVDVDSPANTTDSFCERCQLGQRPLALAHAVRQLAWTITPVVALLAAAVRLYLV